MRLSVIVALAALAFVCGVATGHAKQSIESALDRVKPEAGADKDVALIVAIEDYDKVPDIAGARANARLWRQWFRARGTRDVRVVEDADASHAWSRDGKPHGLLPKIDAAAAQARRKGGTLWFVFIGHGAPVAEGGTAQGVLLAHGVQQTAQSLRTHGIFVDADLMPRLAKAHKSVAILDACFSGQSSSGSLVPGLQPLIPATFSVSRSVTVFTAAKGSEFAGPLPNGRRPAFSYLMLGALAGLADGEVDRKRDRRVTSEEAFEWVKMQMARIIHGRRQTPTMRGPIRTLSRAWAELERTPGPDRPTAAAFAPAPSPKTAQPGTFNSGRMHEAKALLQAFLKPGADYAGLSKALRPASADYKALYNDAFADKLEALYGPAWDAGHLVIRPKDGQTVLLLFSATTDDLKAGNEKASKFPTGYKKVLHELKPGQTLYRFKFVRPGKSLGMAYDGLSHVNGRWVIVPKPWQAEALPPTLPTKLSNREIMDVIRKRKNWVGDCRYQHKALRGSAVVTIVINNNGKVDSAKAGGKFAGTATGRCVEERVRTFKFSGFAGPPMTVRMPFQL